MSIINDRGFLSFIKNRIKLHIIEKEDVSSLKIREEKQTLIINLFHSLCI